MKYDIKNTPSYRVNVNQKGEEWVRIGNLVFKLNRAGEFISVFIMDEREKCAYVVIVDEVTMGDLDQLEFKLSEYVKVTEGQLLALYDCLINFNLYGTMFKKANTASKTRYSITKNGNKYIETDKFLITVSRHAREIIVRATAIGTTAENLSYVITFPENDIHDHSKVMYHLENFRLTADELAVLMELIEDTYYDNFGYKGE